MTETTAAAAGAPPVTGMEGAPGQAPGSLTESVERAGPGAPVEQAQAPAPGEHGGLDGQVEPAGGPGGPVAPDVPVWSGQVAGGRPAMRRTSVIMNETTAEIPVHLLFRDEAPESTAQAFRAVGRPAGHPRGSAGPKRQSARTDTRAQGATRPAPPADAGLAERPGVALPGAAALLSGAVALAGFAAVLWRTGAVPAPVAALLRLDAMPYQGVGPEAGAVLAVLGALALLAFGGLGRGRVGDAWVLSLCGGYRGSVRRTGLVWTSPLLLRRRVDVRLRHWRSEPLRAFDADGTPLRVVVLVVWRIKDTARAAYAVEDH